MASMGQPSTQAGRRPSFRRWAQNMHFSTTPRRCSRWPWIGSGDSASGGSGGSGLCQLNTRTSYGQAAMQYRQPIHRPSSIRTRPSSVRKVALTGHTFTHGGFSQCMHGRGRKNVPLAAVRVNTFIHFCSSGTLCSLRQATSHLKHPSHRRRSISMVHRRRRSGDPEACSCASASKNGALPAAAIAAPAKQVHRRNSRRDTSNASRSLESAMSHPPVLSAPPGGPCHPVLAVRVSVTHARDPRGSHGPHRLVNPVMHPVSEGAAHEVRHPLRDLEERAAEATEREALGIPRQDAARDPEGPHRPVHDRPLEGLRGPPSDPGLLRGVLDEGLAELNAFRPQNLDGPVLPDLLRDPKSTPLNSTH